MSCGASIFRFISLAYISRFKTIFSPRQLKCLTNSGDQSILNCVIVKGITVGNEFYCFFIGQCFNESFVYMKTKALSRSIFTSRYLSLNTRFATTAVGMAKNKTTWGQKTSGSRWMLKHTHTYTHAQTNSWMVFSISLKYRRKCNLWLLILPVWTDGEEYWIQNLLLIFCSS